MRDLLGKNNSILLLTAITFLGSPKWKADGNIIPPSSSFETRRENP